MFRCCSDGASAELIAQLPEFQIDASSKYLQEECQVCKEQFQAGRQTLQDSTVTARVSYADDDC